MELQDFLNQLNSDLPAPGGGGAAALAGALAAALAGMVAHLTVGKAGYEDAAQPMRALLKETTDLQNELAADIARDAEAFNGFMDALHLPKGTEEEQGVRRERMQRALIAAAEAPFAVAERSSAVLPLALEAVVRGNRNVGTDGVISAILASAAVRSALWNVRVNLASIRDANYVAAAQARIDALERRAAEGERTVIEAYRAR